MDSVAVSKEAADALRKEALDFHRKYQGKIEVVSKVPLRDSHDLSLAYTPGVAEPCLDIAENKDLAYDYTSKNNLVAVVSDGTAVLGLGDIGPEAAMPVMEGKAVLFKGFADVDGFPICLDTKEVDKIIEIVKAMSPTFGGINLEDISAPRCFEIEERLKKEIDIPVFHDDQHGTAIVAAAALINALKVVDKKIDEIEVVVNGAGASGVAVTKLIMDMGVKNVILCDTKGAIYEGRPEGMNPFKDEMAKKTNPLKKKGSLADVIKGTDVFMGLSVAGAVTVDMVKSMAADAIIMAMANPTPEIYPDDAEAGGAKVICTGRSDFPNQINNVLAFPGVFRGALDVRARDITEGMKIAAAYAIAELVSEEELGPEYIIPYPWNELVAPRVAAAVAKTAMDEGVARIMRDPAEIERETIERVKRVKKHSVEIK